MALPTEFRKVGKVLSLCALSMAVTLSAYADHGSAAYRKGVRAERQANLDAAYGFYSQAYLLSPKNSRYFMAYTQTRFKAANQHVHNGQLLRNTGKLEQALTEFQQAVDIDPTSFIAHQELRLTTDMLRAREERVATVSAVLTVGSSRNVGPPACPAVIGFVLP